MDITTVGAGEVPKSPDFQFIKGGLSLGSTSVPYYSCSVDVEELTKLCKLPSQLPVNPERPLELEELFQRELDESRVENEIVQYLKNPRQLRFFNSLTVVLMPLDPSGTGEVAREYPEDNEYTPPSPRDSELESKPIGPINISHPQDTEDVGLLSWNTDLIEPVLLDGQHRFWALKSVVDQTSGNLRTRMANSKVSVLFLVLHSEAGFEAARDNPTVPEACRQIFIALNKHAKQVPVVRQQILDDRDLTAVCMRSIMAESVDLQDVQEDFFERVDESMRLPLCAVDWRSNSAKIDSGPHITSSRLLYDVVQEVLEVPEFGPEDYDSARNALEKLDARLDMEGTDKFDLEKEKGEVDRSEKNALPYELPQDIIKVAGERFRDEYGAVIIDPLRYCSPYRKLIERYQAQDLVGTSVEPWFALDEAGRDSYISDRGLDDPSEDVSDIWREIKSKYPLAYQVVFEKAIIYSFRNMRELHRSISDLWKLDDSAGIEGFTEAWADRFNDFVVPALKRSGTESAFFGSGVRFDGNVDYRKTRIPSIAGFITVTLLSPIDEWAEAGRSSSPIGRSSLQDWVKDAWEKIRPGTKSDPLENLYSSAGAPWRRSVLELVEGLTDAGHLDIDTDAEKERWARRHAALQLERVERAVRGVEDVPSLDLDANA